MTTKKELLQRLWDCINRHVTAYYIGRILVREDELDGIVERAKRRPDEPFADAGAAIERILAAGAARRDLCLGVGYATYRTRCGPGQRDQA